MPKGRKNELTLAQKQKVAELYEVHKMGTKAIGQRFGVGFKTVQRVLHEQGVTIQATGRRRDWI